MKELASRLVSKILYKKTAVLVMECNHGYLPQTFFRRHYRQFISFHSDIFGGTTRVRVMNVSTSEGLHVHVRYVLLGNIYPLFKGDTAKYTVLS